MLGQAERILELRKLNGTGGSIKNDSFVVTFTSGKGGTGKTVTALNTAYHLSKMNYKVLLVDFDFNLANIHIMMDALPPYSIYDYFTNRCTIDDAIRNYAPGLDVIYGASGKSDHPAMNREKFKSFLYLLGSKNYDFIIFDTSAGEQKEIFEVAVNSDLAVIVSTPEPTAVMDAYVMLKLMHSNLTDTDTQIIFNKCNSAAEGYAAFENLNKASTHFLKKEAKLMGTILSDSIVNQSIMEQVVLSEKYTGSKAELKYSEIAGRIAKFKQVANSKHDEDSSSNQNAF